MERVWTIARSSDDKDDRLQHLSISLPCQTYITYSNATADASAVAVVRFSGDKRELIQALEVATAKDQATAVTLKPSSAQLPKIEGSLRAEITVYNRQLIETVTAAGSGDVIVLKDVLAESVLDAKIKTVVSGSGTVFFPSGANFQINKLSVDVGGSGGFMLAASDITTQELEVEGTGSGAAIITATAITTTKSLDVKSQGSGVVSVDAKIAETPKVAVAAAGSGDLYVGSSARCEKGSLSAQGSGNVNAGSFHCAEVRVQVTGSGGITLQGDAVSGEAPGTGKIEYLGPLPPAVALTGRLEPISQSTKSQTQTGTQPQSIPARAMSTLTVNGQVVVVGDRSGSGSADGGATVGGDGGNVGSTIPRKISPAARASLTPIVSVVSLIGGVVMLML